MPLDDGKGDKPFEQWLDMPDIADMFAIPYPAGAKATPPAKDIDPGRARTAAFFDKVYGDCRKGEVERNLTTVEWLPKKAKQKLTFNRMNGAAAALATLKETTRLNVAANAAARGAELNKGLAELKDRHELVGDARGKGLMAALELVSDRARKSGASKDAVAKVYETAYDAGVMVRTSGNNVIISPPLVITAADVQRIISALDAGLSAAEGK